MALIQDMKRTQLEGTLAPTGKRCAEGIGGDDATRAVALPRPHPLQLLVRKRLEQLCERRHNRVALCGKSSMSANLLEKTALIPSYVVEVSAPRLKRMDSAAVISSTTRS